MNLQSVRARAGPGSEVAAPFPRWQVSSGAEEAGGRAKGSLVLCPKPALRAPRVGGQSRAMVFSGQRLPEPRW